METEKIIATLHPFERKVLPILKDESSFDKVAEKAKLQKVEVMRAFQWLENKKLIRISKQLNEQVTLGQNGLKYKSHGLPEKAFLQFVMQHEPCSLEELQKGTGLSREEFSICLGILKSKHLIDLEKKNTLLIRLSTQAKLEGKKASVLNQLSEVEDFLNKSFPIYTSQLKDDEKKVFEELKKRKEIVKVNIVKIINAEPTEAGKKIIGHGIEEKDIIGRLTPDSLKSGSWKGKELRNYDVTINVPTISGGRIHFVSQAIDYIKKIWLDLGFKEMNGNFAQTSFWNLDALFAPQDHPSRDMQDTFYIKDPGRGKLPKELVNKIRMAHENGWTTGSKGWRYKWSEEMAKEILLRTQTTVLSAQYLSRLKKENLPAKLFSVGKVFRNETLGWKSLFEFIQVEGIVVDPNADFSHLKGYLKEFFARMGYSDARIRPAHFPYTEPSAEVDVWHPGKKQWIELGGAGLFRPEVVKPLLGFECPVLAWGLGMERTIMEYYSINDVRDIYKNDIKQLREIKLWMK